MTLRRPSVLFIAFIDRVVVNGYCTLSKIESRVHLYSARLTDNNPLTWMQDGNPRGGVAIPSCSQEVT